MGDDQRKALIDGLNQDLANEYTAIISYLLYSRLVQGPHRIDLAGFFEEEIADELNHAKFLSHKIVALGGVPTAEPAPVRLASENREMLELALQAEKETIERYTERIDQADAAGEIGLRVELENVVADETRHKEEIERVLYRWKD